MHAAEMNTRLINAAKRLREAQGAYEDRILAHVEAELAYKQGEAVAMLKVSDYRNAEDRRAQAEPLISDLRYNAHLAEGLRDAAKKAVDNYRQELSALQSLAALSKAEAEFIRTAPREVMEA